MYNDAPTCSINNEMGCKLVVVVWLGVKKLQDGANPSLAKHRCFSAIRRSVPTPAPVVEGGLQAGGGGLVGLRSESTAGQGHSITRQNAAVCSSSPPPRSCRRVNR